MKEGPGSVSGSLLFLSSASCRSFYSGQRLRQNRKSRLSSWPHPARLCVFDKDGRLLSKKESSIDPDKPMVALTFDDGPGPRTKELLDALQKYNAHATFFMLGQKVPSYADQVKRMKELGCELGNHSYDHADLSKLDEEGVQSEISRTNENIRQATGQEASLLRPPYGAISSTMKTVAGLAGAKGNTLHDGGVYTDF